MQRSNRYTVIAPIALLVVLSGTLAACGGGGGGGGAKEQAYVDAIAASISGEEDAPFDQTQAKCLATEMVDAIGVGTIEDAGITPEDIENDPDGGTFDDVGVKLNEEQANNFADAIFDGKCFDFGQMLAEQMGEDGPQLSDEQADCIGDEFAKNESFKAAFAQSIISGDDPDMSGIEDIFDIFADCDIDLADLAG